MQGQGVRAPDSNQDKVIGVELRRQDLTRPFAAKGEQESQDEPPLPPQPPQEGFQQWRCKHLSHFFSFLLFFLLALRKIPYAVPVLGINKRGRVVLNAG